VSNELASVLALVLQWAAREKDFDDFMTIYLSSSPPT